VMMLMTGERQVMGKFVIGGWLRWLGWASTAAMALCVVAMIVGRGSPQIWASGHVPQNF
jgi:Mn2+/Fe2+ NRAMP family transporter